jgi:hypothetical protein
MGELCRSSRAGRVTLLTDLVVLSDPARGRADAVVKAGLRAFPRAGLDARPEWRRVSTTFDLAGYLGAVENGLTFGSLPGTSGVGTHGGSEDHTAILAGVADRVMPTPTSPCATSATIRCRRRGGLSSPRAVCRQTRRAARRSLQSRVLATRGFAEVAKPDQVWPTLAPSVARARRARSAARAAGVHWIQRDSAADLRTRLKHFVDEEFVLQAA